MCKLRPGAPQDQEGEEVEVESEVEGIYERIETVVVQVNFVKKNQNLILQVNAIQQCQFVSHGILAQDGDEGEIIIETEGYEESEIFVENGLLIEAIPMNQNILVDTTVEEGIVEEDGIKYETQLVSL